MTRLDDYERSGLRRLSEAVSGRENPTLQLAVTAVTNRGVARTQNEDTISVFGWMSSADEGTRLAMERPTSQPTLLLVADGMGGLDYGEIASRETASHLNRNVLRLNSKEGIESVIAESHEQLKHIAAGYDSNPMGTTVAGLVAHGSQAAIFNVGDSRIYRYDAEHRVEKLSRDDSDPGAPKFVITQSIGAGDAPPEPHIKYLDISPTDRFLICSDGVTDPLDTAEGRAILDRLFREQRPSHAFVEAIVKLALDRGSSDHVSVILASFAAMETDPSPVTEPPTVQPVARIPVAQAPVAQPPAPSPGDDRLPDPAWSALPGLEPSVESASPGPRRVDGSAESIGDDESEAIESAELSFGVRMWRAFLAGLRRAFAVLRRRWLLFSSVALLVVAFTIGLYLTRLSGRSLTIRLEESSQGLVLPGSVNEEFAYSWPDISGLVEMGIDRV